MAAAGPASSDGSAQREGTNLIYEQDLVNSPRGGLRPFQKTREKP
jgi:hypothetical protein